MPEKKVSLSLPDELRAWWDDLPDQTRARTVREIIRASRKFREWRKKR